MELAGRTVKINSLEVDGVDHHDYPDFCDAYFSYAEFEDDGSPLDDAQLEELSELYADVINMMACEGSFAGYDEDYGRDR
jgi:hypothetical protein